MCCHVVEILIVNFDCYNFTVRYQLQILHFFSMFKLIILIPYAISREKLIIGQRKHFCRKISLQTHGNCESHSRLRDLRESECRKVLHV